MDFQPSYVPNYFSIEDILTTQEKIPCKFEITVKKLGRIIDPSADSDDIATGTSLELPFWLAKSLNVRRQPIVSIETPKVYKDLYRQILKADACVVDLYNFNAFFYEFGMALSSINHREAPLINASLVQTFKERFRLILDWSQNKRNDHVSIQKLDILERQLLSVGVDAQNKLLDWLNGTITSIEASSMVQVLQKHEMASTSQSNGT